MKTERKNLFTISNLSERERKNLEIFDLMTRRGAVSRTDISKETGINMVSVAHYIKEFIDKGLVLETGLDVSSGGRKPELIELESKNRIMGIDIGLTEARATLTDMLIRVTEKVNIPFRHTGEREIADHSLKLIEGLLKKSGQSKDSISAIGVGVTSEALFPLAGAIEEAFGKRTFIARNYFCAAFGEKALNPKAADRDILYVHSDLGVGVVIIKNGIVLGPAAEGEGAIISDDNSFRKGEGSISEKTKYLRPWGSNLEIAKTARREVARGVGTKIVAIVKGDIDSISMDSVIEAAKNGDQVASEIVASAGINLGLRIAYLINLFYPQIVVVGGGTEKAEDLVFGPIKKMVERLALEKKSGSLEIAPGALGEDSVSLGAASLAAREMFLRA
ncbi:MAG: ROK family protein [Candidatus Omnitrophota bacterium]|nr:ROK family protein [Candidatus Omnitrophota bacterium]